MLGQVAAGVPIGADIGSDQVLILDRVLFSPKPDYLLKVKGDSMIDEGIFDGDLIGVHRTADARNGQIVVARIDEEITVKLLKKSSDRIRLLPRNPDYAPIDVLPGQDVYKRHAFDMALLEQRKIGLADADFLGQRL